MCASVYLCISDKLITLGKNIDLLVDLSPLEVDSGITLGLTCSSNETQGIVSIAQVRHDVVIKNLLTDETCRIGEKKPCRSQM